jgi:hypothetical protein
MAIADPRLRFRFPGSTEGTLAKHRASNTFLPVDQTNNNRVEVRAPAGAEVPLSLGPIDDLTKYRIVEFLLGCQSGGDAAFIARSLGFHSVEWTIGALRELTAAGLCVESEGLDIPIFRLSPGALTRSEVQQLRLNQARGRVDGELFRSLATNSLKRARQLAPLVGGPST